MSIEQTQLLLNFLIGFPVRWFYADDVIFVCRSPDCLQDLLDCVSILCINWKMTVNSSKCILFTTKSSLNKTDNFCIGDHYPKNVSPFTSLGAEINTAGLFRGGGSVRIGMPQHVYENFPITREP